MSSRWGRPTTTGRSHNRSNTYSSERIVGELIPEKKTKIISTLVTSFFKPLSSDGQTKVANADIITNYSETACSGNLRLNDSSGYEDSVSKSEHEAS